MLPSPMELTYFSEIANCLSLSRAAKKLGVTQPSLSIAIKKLEHTLNTHLLIRHKHGVTLTAAGEALLDEVKPLLEHWEKTRLKVKDSHSEVQGRVTIGCRTVTAILLQELLKEFLQKHPLLEINFQFENHNTIVESIIKSTMDIGIVANPERHLDLIIYKFNEIEMSFWASEGNNKAQDIASGEAVIICEPNVPQVQALLKHLERSRVKIARVMTANNLEVVAQLTMQGLGIGILPTCVATLSYPGKLFRLHDLPAQTNDLCMIYRYENKNVKAVNTVIAALKEFSKKSKLADV